MSTNPHVTAAQALTAGLPTSDAEAIVVLGDRIAPLIGVAWMRAVRAARAAFDARAFRAAYRAGDAVKAQAIAMAAWSDFGEPILEGDYVPILRDGFEAAARATAARIPEQPRRPPDMVLKREGGRPFSYSIADDTTLRMVMEYGADRVREISKGQEEALRQSLAAMYRNGWSAEEAAADIRQHIGLTDFQAQSNVNFHQRLIRDREHARTNDRPSKTLDEIRRLVAEHAERLLVQRSVTIAVTESKLATGRGQRDAWRQAADRGWVDADVAVLVWLTARDERVCEICGPMHGQTQPFARAMGLTGGAVFLTGDGREVTMPADTHPRCRCGVHLQPHGVRRLGARGRTPARASVRHIRPALPEVGIAAAIAAG